MIAKDAYSHWRSNLDVLLDVAPEPGYKEIVARIVVEYHPKERLHFVKIRRTGTQYWLGLGLDFPDDVSLAETELVIRRLSVLLRRKLDWVAEVECFHCVVAE